MTPGEERVWRRFIAWLPSAEPSGNPGQLLGQYRAWLVGAGHPEPEVAQHLILVMNGMRTRSEGWRVIFNGIYASETPGFSTAPNALLAAAVEGRLPGRALDAGMGEGRNAVFLACEGWDVTGLEVADEGVAIARRNAEAAGVSITSVLESDATFDYGTARWDLIVATYQPFALTEPAYVARLRAALRPGGLVVVESFASDADAPVRRPVDIDPLGLRRAFEGFRIVRFEDAVGMPDWGTEETRLVRMVAEGAP